MWLFEGYTWKHWLALVILTLVMMSCGSAPVTAKEADIAVCENVAAHWDDKSRTYSVNKVESVNRHNTVYYCILSAEKHLPEYTMHVTLRLTYNSEGDGYTVKRF